MKTITGLNWPWGIAVCVNGDIVVADIDAHCVTIVNKEGKKVRLFSTTGAKDRQFNGPCGITISKDEYIILALDRH